MGDEIDMDGNKIDIGLTTTRTLSGEPVNSATSETTGKSHAIMAKLLHVTLATGMAIKPNIMLILSR